MPHASPLPLLRLLTTALFLAPIVGEAQVQEMKGVVLGVRSSEPVGGAVLTFLRRLGGDTVEVVRSDSTGGFKLSVAFNDDLGFLLVTRRLGYRPDTTIVQRVPRGSLQIYLLEVAQDVGAMEVTARPTRNQVAYDEAVGRGWRVFGPEKVEPYRARAGNLTMLLRLMSVPGVIPARHNNDCIRSMRNNQCLAVVVDGVNAGPIVFVTPSDIDFIAIVGAAESRMFFGERAPFGAIVIHTREPGQAPRRARRP